MQRIQRAGQIDDCASQAGDPEAVDLDHIAVGDRRAAQVDVTPDLALTLTIPRQMNAVHGRERNRVLKKVSLAEAGKVCSWTAKSWLCWYGFFFLKNVEQF